MEEKSKLRLILLGGVLAVTSSSFIIRFAKQESYALAFVRVFFTGTISYFIISDPRKLLDNITKKDMVKIFIAGFSLATHFGWWFDSLNYVAIGASLSLTNTAPVWLAIISWIVYKLKPTNTQFISILLVITGSIILFIDVPQIDVGGTYGLTLALGSAIGFAVYLLIARDLVPKFGLWAYFGMVNMTSALVFIPWLFLNTEIQALDELNIWIWGLSLALIPGILGHAVYNYSMAKLDPIDVGMATLGEPVLGTFLAFLIFNETLSIYQITALLLLLVAILLSLRFDRREEKLEEKSLKSKN